MFLSTPRNFGDRNNQNANIFLKCGEGERLEMLPICLPFGVSTGGRWLVSLCYFADVSKIGQDPAGCSAFCPPYCFALGVLALNMAPFRVLKAFLARFVGFVWVCVVLVLCLACGAFVRV